MASDIKDGYRRDLAGRVDGRPRVIIRDTLTLYGNGLTLFGKASGQIEVTYEGELLDDQLIGTATDAEYRMHFRSTRVGSIPATAH